MIKGRGTNFLTFAEYDAFLIKGEMTPTNPSQVGRLEATKRGMVVVVLLGKLLEANIIHNGDVALAAELLFENRKRHGYMRALYTLLYYAGDKVCRHASLQRIVNVQTGLEAAKEELGLYEIKHFAQVSLLGLRIFGNTY